MDLRTSERVAWTGLPFIQQYQDFSYIYRTIRLGSLLVFDTHYCTSLLTDLRCHE